MTTGTQGQHYLDLALGAFGRACLTAGRHVRHLFVAGADVQIEFAGPALLPTLLPALSHLSSVAGIEHAGRATAMRLLVWDTASTGVPIPEPTRPTDGSLPRGELSNVDGDDLKGAYSDDGPAIELWHGPSSTGMLWLHDWRRISVHRRGAPAKNVLAWWLHSTGAELVHAGAIGNRDHAVLLTGKGGSGKSNTALACWQAGLAYLADDYCAVATAPRPLVHSVYCSGKVTDADLTRLPSLRGRGADVTREPDEKGLYLLPDVPPGVRHSLPLVGLVAVTVSAGETRLTPASPGDVVRDVALSTMAQVPYAGEQVLRAVASIARQLPTFRLHVGRDAASSAPALLRDLLDRAIAR